MDEPAKVMRLPDVSGEILREILSYLEVPVYLGRLACVCRTTRIGIRDDRHLWERAYRDRWGRGPSSSREPASLYDVPYGALRCYKERHIQDYQLLRTLQGLQGMVGVLVGHHVRVDADLKNYQVLVAVLRSHRRGECTNKDASKLYPLPQRISSTEQWLAWCVFRSVQLFKTNSDVLELFGTHDRGEISPLEDMKILERGAIWLSEFLMDVEDVVEADYWPSDIGRRARTLLDNLANEISSKLSQTQAWAHRGEPNCVSETVNVIAKQFGFSGDERQYYNEKNSSITHVLEARKGIPISLAVTFKLLLHRLGYSVDVIGLPGHVVLGVPGGDSTVFLDVFHGCKVMSVTDCRNLAISYGVEWSTTFLEPLSAAAILSRMLRNVLTCRVMAFNSNSSSENMDSLFKIRDLHDHFQSAVTHYEEGRSDWITTFRQRINQPREFILDGRSLDFFRTVEEPRRRTASF